MAVNKKGKGVNTIDEGEDFGLADLGRLEEQYAREPAAIRELRARAQRAKVERREMNKLGEVSPLVAALPEFQQEVKINEKTTAGLENRLRINKIATRERVNAQAMNVVGREFSDRAVNSYVNANSNSLEAQVSGANAAWQGYGSLAQQKSNIMNQMQGLRQDSMSAAGGYIGNRGVNAPAQATIQENAGQMKDLASQLIPITLAMQQLKQQGQDPQGKQRSLINMGDKASGVLSYNKLEDEMRSGKGLGALSAGDLRKKEAEAAEKLIKALDELRGAAGKTKDELEVLNKTAEDAAKEFGDMSEARSMGGSSSNGAKLTGAYASAVANVANLVGNTIQTMAVNQPMQQMSNIGGYANLENQKYDMWKSGNEGNMTERMNMGGWANAGEFGKQMANRTGWVVGSRIVGGAAATVAGAAQLADAATSVEAGTVTSKLGLHDANTVQTLAGGVQAAGEGLAMTMIQGKDAVQHISTSQAEIQANIAAMGTTKQLNHISGYQLQQYRDYDMGLNKGAMSLGSQAGSFMDQAGGSAFMTRMQGVGLGMGEMANLSQQGAQNMGSTFNADQAIKAKHLENLGLGSASENMARMGTFAGAGAQNPMQSMEKVLERAVGSGLSSSKSLTMIAENTGQMVEQSNARGSGVDTTDEIARMILGAVDKKNTNQEFAGQQAANTFKSEEGFKTNASTSFSGMVAISRMQKDLGLDFNSALSLQTTSTGMWTTWRDLAKHNKVDRVEQEMRNQGIDVSKNELFKKDPNAFFDKVSSDKVLSQLERGGAGWATGATKDFAALQQWVGADKGKMKIFTGDDAAGEAAAPEWVRNALLAINQSVRNNDPNANPLAVRRDLGVGLNYVDAASANALPREGTMRQDAFGASQEEKSLGERQRTAAAQQGIGTLAGANYSGTTAGVATTATGRVNQSLPGENAEAKFAEAAAKSAADFGASAIQLNFASGKLIDAANKLMEFAGGSKLNKEDEETRRKIKQMEDKVPRLGDNLTSRVDGGTP